MKYYYLKRHKGIFKYYQNGHILYGYRLRFTKHHKQHEKSKRGFKTLVDAMRDLSNAKIFNLDDTDKGNLTVKACISNYLNSIKPPIRKISTYMSYKRLLNENIIPVMGNLTLNELELDNYQTVINNLFKKKGLSRRTVLETNARLQAVINYAVRSGYIKSNPIKWATISKTNVKPKKVIMNDKELAKFNATIAKQPLNIRVLFKTLQGTGMRIGELLALHWCDVDLDKHIIHIKYTRDGFGLRKPKTDNSKRSFKITNDLNSLLSKYAIYCKKHFKVNSDSFVLRNKQGKPFSPTMPAKILRKILITSGLSDLQHIFTIHSIRHQFISGLIAKGISPITVASIAGHTVKVLLSTYANKKHNVVPDISKLLK